MPYTKTELKKNSFWKKLHEQDRVNYQNKLDHALALQDVVEVVDENLGKVKLQQSVPLRDESGTFLAFEDPDTGLNYNQPNQLITIDKKSPRYHRGELWNKILDREITELI